MRLYRFCYLIALLSLLFALGGCTTGRNVSAASANGKGDTGTLREVLITDVTTLDPAKTPDLTTGEMLLQVFEGLVRYNEKNELEPRLAERWELSKDGKTYTFHLRKGVTFHNGLPFTAADVKYSWERALDPKTASTVSANYLDGVLGVKEVVAGKRKDLVGVEVVDPLTLKVTLDRPRSFFLAMLTYPTNYVVPKETVEKNGGVVDQKAFIGTGPFKLESYQPGIKTVLAANPSYWEGPPRLARIELPVILDQETQYINFETGAVDLIPQSVPFARYTEDKKTGKFSGEYQMLKMAQVDYIVMHPKKQPEFAKKEVRLAFAMAIDREEIRKLAYQNMADIADGMLPPQIPGVTKSPARIPYDPKRARELLAQAGYPGGKGFPALTLQTLEKQAIWSAACQLVRANLKENLNIDVTIQEREAGQYWDDQARAAYGFYITGWIADYPDPQDFLSTLFVTGAQINRVGYSNPRFDALCGQADAERDADRRAALYMEADRLLMDDVAVLPVTFPPRSTLIHKNVVGWQTNLCNILPFTKTTKTAP